MIAPQEQAIQRICRSCSQPFSINPDEQRFLQKLSVMRGWTKRDCLPWHCAPCRENRKREREEQEQ